MISEPVLLSPAVFRQAALHHFQSSGTWLLHHFQIFRHVAFTPLPNLPACGFYTTSKSSVMWLLHHFQIFRHVAFILATAYFLMLFFLILLFLFAASWCWSVLLDWSSISSYYWLVPFFNFWTNRTNVEMRAALCPSLVAPLVPSFSTPATHLCNKKKKYFSTLSILFYSFFLNYLHLNFLHDLFIITIMPI